MSRQLLDVVRSRLAADYDAVAVYRDACAMQATAQMVRQMFHYKFDFICNDRFAVEGLSASDHTAILHRHCMEPSRMPL
ncbi:MAG: hypothetical protein DWQ37_07540 [Planctomycetota bacterium]|nr:MAG: hypothetical protein DWQ37_07540 [Planctomycetota bacterium]